MRLCCVALVLAFGCGSKASGSGDDVPGDAPGGGDDDADPGCTDPADCPADVGTFVATMTGDDGNPGTKAMPLKTIAAGIAHARALGGPQAVFVAEGTYAEKVTLAEDIDLNGSYECNPSSCSWDRDLAMYAATITNQDFEGVLAGPAISAATLLGGFTIIGKGGAPTAAPGSAGVMIAGGAPTVRGNKIVGGNVTGGNVTGSDRSIGIAIRGTGGNVAVIENNDVTGGSAVGLSAAISIEAANGVPARAAITANLLRSGTARRSDGIAAFGSSPSTIVTNNDIISGNSTNGASNGIEVTSAMLITGNRIDVDPATGTCTNPTTWCAGVTSNGGSATLTNNVVYGPKGLRSAAVFLTESETPAGEVIVNSNYLNGGGTGGNASGLSRNESAAVAVSIGQCTNCGLHGFVGRVRNNILDGGLNLNRYGVREDPSQARTTRVELLEANDIWFSALPNRSDTLYRQVTVVGTPIDIKQLEVLDQMSTPPASKNLNADPQLSASWHLAATSPCVNAGVATEAPSTDFDGDNRPAAGLFDIGADEE